MRVGKSSPSQRTHITYEGVKDGKAYIGYVSMEGLGLNGDDILKYRYNGDFSKFDVKPKVVYVGDGQTGKDIAKGLEQRLFENRGGLENTSNKQNPCIK